MWARLLLAFSARFPRLAGITSIRIDILAGVVGIQYLLEMAAVMHRGCVGLKRADDLVVLTHIDRQRITEVALALLFGPAGI